ncbi:MAG: hypothetical protein E7177_02870 [Erysipelotrichaceae bacterium]|nr:hypothetical protein [Erysipelotrichaceae bacterium]
MSNSEIKRYTALEISSKTVRLVHGYALDGLVYVLHALESNVNALDAGFVVESDALTAAIKGVINAANEMLNIKIREVVLALPPMGLVFIRENAITNTISLDNKIAQIDINNCISQLKKVRLSENLKIIDVVPYSYTLENHENHYEAPIGRTSETLTVHASIYALDRNLVDGYLKVIENAGVKVRQMVVAPFATALYLQDNEQVTTTSASYYLLNIGSEITSLTQITHRNLISQSGCFKFGSDRITEYMAERLNLSTKEAKVLKEKYGMDHEPSFKVNVYNGLTIKDISTTIREAVDPLITAIKKQIATWSSNDSRYLPIVLTGGGTKLNGLKELLEKELQVTIIDATPYSFGARDKSYQNCLGLIKYADKFIPMEADDEFAQTTISRVQSKDSRRHSYNVHEEL